MPDNREAGAPQGAAEEPRRVLNLRTEGTRTNYANMAVVSTTPEEVVISFGINVSPPTAEQEVNVEIVSRVIMTYASAKRLALTLGNVLQRHEAQHGPIEVGPRGPQARPQSGSADA